MGASDVGFRWLIIPVEVKYREFHSRIILSALAASRGYRVLLGKDTMIRRLAPALPRGVILDKSLGVARHGKPQRFARLGHRVVVMDEESTGYYGSPEQFLSVRLAGETLAACRRWYCVSDILRDHAVRLYPDHAERFLTAGLMRTDSWRPAFHGLYAAERRRIAEAHGPFILFNSNFGGLIHARGERFVDKQIRGQKTAYAQVTDRMAQIFAEGRPNLAAFVSVVPKVADWFPSHRIVVRPHPSETVAFWNDAFAGDPRIAVSNEGVATPWILASDALFHHGCTTGIEADLLGKPNVMYAPHPDEHHETEVMKAFAPMVRTESDLRAQIAKALEGSPARGNRERQTRYFSNLSGRLVAEAVLADIDRLAFASADLPERLPPDVLMRIWLARNKRRSGRERAYIRQKWPGTSLAEIADCLRVAAAGLGLGHGFAVEERFDEVYEIGAAIA